MSSQYLAEAPHDPRLIITPENKIITPQEAIARARFKVSPLAMHAVRTIRNSYTIEGITIPGERPEFVEAGDYNVGVLLELTTSVYQLVPMRDACKEWGQRLGKGQATANEIYRFFCDVHDLLGPFVQTSEIKMDLSGIRLIMDSATFTLSANALEAADAFMERFKVASIADPEESPKITRCRLALLIDITTEIFRFRKVHKELVIWRDRMRASHATVRDLLWFFQTGLGNAFSYLPQYG
jgi:hypothetical protein